MQNYTEKDGARAEDKNTARRARKEAAGFDWFDHKVYSVINTQRNSLVGFITEYVDHPTLIRSVAVEVKRGEEHGEVLGPGSLTAYMKNGQSISFACYPTAVFCGQYGIMASEDGERFYVISDVKGLWCYSKHGEVLWKTRYTSAGHVMPHPDGTVTCVTSGYIILLDANGKPIKKRRLFSGPISRPSLQTVAALTSEGVAAVFDAYTLEPLVKISLSKLNLYWYKDIVAADEYYILFGTDLMGIAQRSDGRRDVAQSEVVWILDKDGNTVKKCTDVQWSGDCRGYVDRETNEIVLYTPYRKATGETLRISLAP